jgi:hypothetical protein
MAVGDQHHASAVLPPGKKSGTHSIGGWVGLKACLDGDRIGGKMYVWKIHEYCATGKGNSVKGYILFPMFTNIPEKLLFIHL